MPAISKKGRTLVDAETGSTICDGAVRESFRGERYVITGGEPPRHEGSTGRVYVYLEADYETRACEREYFPSVFGLEWR